MVCLFGLGIARQQEGNSSPWAGKTGSYWAEHDWLFHFFLNFRRWNWMQNPDQNHEFGSSDVILISFFFKKLILLPPSIPDRNSGSFNFWPTPCRPSAYPLHVSVISEDAVLINCYLLPVRMQWERCTMTHQPPKINCSQSKFVAPDELWLCWGGPAYYKARCTMEPHGVSGHALQCKVGSSAPVPQPGNWEYQGAQWRDTGAARTHSVRRSQL